MNSIIGINLGSTSGNHLLLEAVELIETNLKWTHCIIHRCVNFYSNSNNSQLAIAFVKQNFWLSKHAISCNENVYRKKTNLPIVMNCSDCKAIYFERNCLKRKIIIVISVVIYWYDMWTIFILCDWTGTLICNFFLRSVLWYKNCPCTIWNSYPSYLSQHIWAEYRPASTVKSIRIAFALNGCVIIYLDTILNIQQLCYWCFFSL